MLLIKIIMSILLNQTPCISGLHRGLISYNPVTNEKKPEGCDVSPETVSSKIIFLIEIEQH